MKTTTSTLAFIVLFAIVSAITMQINFAKLIGAESQYFTFFQFVGPIAGGFLGPALGAIVALLAQAIQFVATGKETTLLNLFRLTPMVFAAYYFGTKNKKFEILVPLAALILWFYHPVGRNVWWTPIYFLIPLIIAFKFKDRLFFKSLGATFTAYTIGAVFWIYLIPTDQAYWMLLLPITAYERFIFALGISLSFIGFTTVLSGLKLPAFVKIDSRYTVANLLKTYSPIRA